MNTIGIDDNLNRARIKKLLTIGLVASLITAAGDFLLGFGTEVRGESFASNLLANAMNLSDRQIIWGGLLGFIGICADMATWTCCAGKKYRGVSKKRELRLKRTRSKKACGSILSHENL